MTNNNEQPIIIWNEQWFKLIQELADLAFRWAGMNAYTTVATIYQTAKNYWAYEMELTEKIKKELEEEDKNLKHNKK